MVLSFFKNLFSNASSKDKDADDAVKAQDNAEPAEGDELSSQESESGELQAEAETTVERRHSSNGRGRKGGRHHRRQSSEEEAVSVDPAEEERILGKLQEFVEYTSKSLVDNPEEVKVDLEKDGGSNVFMISCVKKDTGKLIGKSGKIIASLRILVSGAASKCGVRATVDIRD